MGPNQCRQTRLVQYYHTINNLYVLLYSIMPGTLFIILLVLYSILLLILQHHNHPRDKHTHIRCKHHETAQCRRSQVSAHESCPVFCFYCCTWAVCYCCAAYCCCAVSYCYCAVYYSYCCCAVFYCFCIQQFITAAPHKY